MFTQLMNNINAQIVYSIYKITLAQKMAPSPMQRNNISMSAPAKVSLESNNSSDSSNLKQATKETTGKKVGRNDLCPCGSGKKYKKCCGK
jgi:preprotein translocase subunit SecA